MLKSNSARWAIILCFALLAAGCGDDDTPTAPTTTDPDPDPDPVYGHGNLVRFVRGRAHLR